MPLSLRIKIRLIISVYFLLSPDLLVASMKANNCINHQSQEMALKKSAKAYVTPEILFARAAPDRHSRVISMLTRGKVLSELDEAKVFDKDHLWTKVSWLDSANRIQSAWVDRNYISSDPLAHLNETSHLKDIDFAFSEKACVHKENPRRKVRGIYLTMYSAMVRNLDRFLELANRTSINSFVVDYKDERGKVLFKSKTVDSMHPKEAKRVLMKNPKTLPDRTKLENIYLIGKLVVFKDNSFARSNPNLALKNRDGTIFEDRDGIAWVNPHERQYWEYVLGIAEEMARSGVNEIQFDYIRFPDTNKPLQLTKTQRVNRIKVIHEFLKEAYQRLKPYGVYVSADVFGLVPNTNGDLYIGQHWESLSSVVDYISPMMYPSHYARGFGSIKHPDKEPYKTIYRSARPAVSRSKKLKYPATIRPWIQGFTATWLGSHSNYGPQELQAQIDALNDLGIDEYLIWNPQSRYKNLLKEKQTLSIDVADTTGN